MKHKVYIFDFDGTLVHSNTIKREAFYRLSPEIIQHRHAVDDVLSRMPEKSRFEIVKAIYALIEEETNKTFDEQVVNEAIHNYSSTVREGVLACPELEGASQLLSAIKKSGGLVYVSSNTPEDPLKELVSARGWLKYIDGCFGFPKQKIDTVKRILASNQLSASDVIIIGDGKSDEDSAIFNGCHFYKISHSRSLVEFKELVNRSNPHV
jgi:phosphoglycolate phosphatase-like HAD superfamily hydrolase